MMCDRCKVQTKAITMSFFDTAIICMKCLAIEKSHPAWKAACEAEQDKVLAGDYNFEGIGLPLDLKARFEMEKSCIGLPTHCS